MYLSPNVTNLSCLSKCWGLLFHNPLHMLLLSITLFKGEPWKSQITDTSRGVWPPPFIHFFGHFHFLGCSAAEYTMNSAKKHYQKMNWRMHNPKTTSEEAFWIVIVFSLTKPSWQIHYSHINQTLLRDLVIIIQRYNSISTVPTFAKRMYKLKLLQQNSEKPLFYTPSVP